MVNKTHIISQITFHVRRELKDLFICALKQGCGILATVMTSLITNGDEACKCTCYLELHLIEEIILYTIGSIHIQRANFQWSGLRIKAGLTYAL